MGYSSLLPFNKSVIRIHRKQFLLSAIFLFLFIVLFFSGRIEINKTLTKSIEKSGIQLSSKYALDYDKDINSLLQVLSTQDLREYLERENKDPLSQVLSSKIIIDKLFDLLVICNNEGKVIASSRVTKSGTLLPYVNILNSNLSEEDWFKSFSFSKDEISIIHLSKDDPIAQMTFSNKNVKLSIAKFKDLQYYLLGYTDEEGFNSSLSSDMKSSNYIMVLLSNNKNRRVFKNNNSIELQSIIDVNKNLTKKGFQSITISIPKSNNISGNISHSNKINIFYKALPYPIIYSYLTLFFIILIIPVTTLLFYFLSNRSLAKLKINTEEFLKNGKVSSDFSSKFSDRLLVEPENLEKLKDLSIDIQEGLKNSSNEKSLIDTGYALMKAISCLNNIDIKDWAEETLQKQVPKYNTNNISILKTKILNFDYNYSGNKIESLEKIISLLTDVTIKGLDDEFFHFTKTTKDINLVFDFNESYNNFTLFYKIDNIKLNTKKLDNSKTSLFINEDDPKYILNKSLIKDDENLNLFHDVVMHIHEMRGVLFTKNGVDGLVFQISLPILYSNLLEIDINDKKLYTHLKCSKAWTSHYDTEYFNNRLRMISTTYKLNNILLDIDDMEEISEIALVRLFRLQNEIESNNGKLVIYKSFGKMESQHFYNLLGMKNKLNIYGDLKLAKATFSDKKEEEKTELEIERNDTYATIKLSGKMSTVQSAKEFISKLKESVKTEKNIVIDMTATTFLNSSVLGVLASESLRFTKMGGKMVMLNPNDYVIESLEVFALDKIIPIVHNPEELDKKFNDK